MSDLLVQKSYQQDGMLYVSTKELAEITRAAVSPLAILCYSEWCPDCQEIKPLFESVARRYRDECFFAKAILDEHEGLGHTLGIYAIPTLLFVHEGHQMGKIVGYLTSSELEAAVNNFLTTLNPGRQ